MEMMTKGSICWWCGQDQPEVQGRPAVEQLFLLRVRRMLYADQSHRLLKLTGARGDFLGENGQKSEGREKVTGL